MGLYDKIQKGLNKAYEGTLKDATRTLQFITTVDSYDKDTMESTQTETSVDVRSVVEKDTKSEIQDGPDSTGVFNIIVLDSDKNGVVFEKDMKVKDQDDYFKIKTFDTDPAKAAWIIKARKLG